MKTAMQQLEKMLQDLNSPLDSIEAKAFNSALGTIALFIEIKFKDIEQRQICEAWDAGKAESVTKSQIVDEGKSILFYSEKFGEEYFTQTYSNEKDTNS